MKKGKSRKIRRSILFLLIGSLVVIAALVGIRMWGDEEDGMLSAKTLASTYGEGLMEDAQLLSSQKQQGLDERIQAYLTANGISSASVQYSIEDLTTHERFTKDAQMNVTVASVYKLPLAMLYYEKIAEGEVSEQTLYTYEASHYEQGGPISLRYSVGDQIELGELLEALIIESDHTAGHILYENLGGWPAFKQAITKYSDTPQSDEFFSYDNVLNADYVGDVLGYLYAHEEEYAQLIDDLKEAMPGEYLESVIQPETAQKYGLYDVYRNVAGIVYGEHPYSIAIFSSLGESGSRVIGEINAICYEYFNGVSWEAPA